MYTYRLTFVELKPCPPHFLSNTLPLFCRFVSFNLGSISAEEMWQYFGTIINGLFDEQDNNELFPPNEYLQLFFAVSITHSRQHGFCRGCAVTTKDSLTIVGPPPFILSSFSSSSCPSSFSSLHFHSFLHSPLLLLFPCHLPAPLHPLLSLFSLPSHTTSSLLGQGLL